MCTLLHCDSVYTYTRTPCLVVQSPTRYNPSLRKHAHTSILPSLIPRSLQFSRSPSHTTSFFVQSLSLIWVSVVVLSTTRRSAIALRYLSIPVLSIAPLAPVIPAADSLMHFPSLIRLLFMLMCCVLLLLRTPIVAVMLLRSYSTLTSSLCCITSPKRWTLVSSAV